MAHPLREARRRENADGMLAGCCGIAAATTVAVAAGGVRHHVLAIAIVACAVLTVAARLRRTQAAIASTVIGWLFFDGFIIGRHASLGWDGAREWWWLAVLASAAMGGVVLGRALARSGRGTLDGGGPSGGQVAALESWRDRERAA